MDKRLLAIGNTLILKNDNISPPGLYNGKMGNIIFLYHNAELLGCEIFRKFGDNLIDRIYEVIGKDKQIPENFAEGLSGIGWGLEYLIQHNFVESGQDNICRQMDYILKKRWDVGRLMNMEFPIGADILYWWMRYREGISSENQLVIDDMDNLLIYYGQLISVAPSCFPLSVINTVLFLILNYSTLTDITPRIISKITELVQKQMNSGIISVIDLDTTKRFVSLKPGLFSKTFRQRIEKTVLVDPAEKEESVDYLQRCAWQNLIYFNNESTVVQKEMAEHWITLDYVEERLLKLKKDEISLKGGLTALGMMIVQTKK